MLKVKKPAIKNKGMQASTRALAKEDKSKHVFARVPLRLFRKLHRELIERDVTLQFWLMEKIDQINKKQPENQEEI